MYGFSKTYTYVGDYIHMYIRKLFPVERLACWKTKIQLLAKEVDPKFPVRGSKHNGS